jgi:hypothetical protein
MIRYLVCMILVTGCAGKTDADRPVQKNPGSTTTTQPVVQHNHRPNVQYNQLKKYLISADSVILLSHHSPNMPIKNPKTGEYYSRYIPFIEDGTVNYTMSVQERKQLSKSGIKELADILTAPAVDDGFRAACFQPRNAVVAFKKDRMAGFDFCFDCFGFSLYGDFDSALIMDGNKYKKLKTFYQKHGFKYEME